MVACDSGWADVAALAVFFVGILSGFALLVWATKDD
jgi:hypothetical protein